MTLIRDFAQNIKSDGDLVISGNIGLAETPSDFGAGYALRVGNATKGGSVVLRSHADGNSGLLHFIHKDGAAAMQLGTSTDTAPSPDEIYGYIYNYNHDFRIQGDNGTHLVVDGSGNVGIGGITPTGLLTLGTGTFSAAAANTSALYTSTTAGLVAVADGFLLVDRAGADVFKVDTSGNVGIGTGSDTLNSKLVVKGGVNNISAYSTTTTDQPGLFVANNSAFNTSTNTLYAKIYGSGISANAFGVTLGDYAVVASDGTDNNGLLIGSFNNAPTIFGTNSTERMRIDSAGNLIFLGTGGTTTNSIDISYNGTSGQGSFYVDSDSGDTFLSFGTSSSGSLAEAMRINSSRDVTFNSYIESGDEITVTGSRILAGRYSSGHIATWGGQRSSGGPVMGYGVWPATTGTGADFVSSSGIALQRSAFALNGNVFQWWSADTSTTTLDSSVTLDLEMELGRTGLLLNDGTKLLVGGSNVTPLAGTQVYIKKQDASTNLQRWGEGDANDSNSYRFRIDQDFKFIGNDGTITDYGLAANGDTVEVNSSTGIIKFKNGGGIDFNVAQSTAAGTTPTASATLDDYEEGAWTPTLKGSTGNPSGITWTGGSPKARYTKIGRTVHIEMDIYASAITTDGTGGFSMGGLPFDISTEGSWTGLFVSFGEPNVERLVSAATNVQALGVAGTDTFRLYKNNLGTAGMDQLLWSTDIASEVRIRLSGTYSADT